MSISEIVGSSAGGLFILLTLIQITPIKFNPWSAIAKGIGNAINKDIKDDIKVIKNDIDQIKKEADERNAITSRVRILRFNDELLQNIDHTKDYFDQILSDIDNYEKYCDINPAFRNNMTILAVENIKKCYQNCLAKHKFLQN